MGNFLNVTRKMQFFGKKCLQRRKIYINFFLICWEKFYFLFDIKYSSIFNIGFETVQNAINCFENIWKNTLQQIFFNLKTSLKHFEDCRSIKTSPNAKNRFDGTIFVRKESLTSKKRTANRDADWILGTKWDIYFRLTFDHFRSEVNLLVIYVLYVKLS